MYSHTRESDGKIRYLNRRIAKNGSTMYFFSASPREETGCDMPDGYVVDEKKHLTFLRKIESQDS